MTFHPWSIIKFHALLRGNSSSVSTTGQNRKWYRCESCTFVWNCMWQCNFHLKWYAHLAHHLIFTYDWKRFSSLHRSHSTWILWPIGSCHLSAKCGRNVMSAKPFRGGLSVSCLWHDICLCHLSGTKQGCHTTIPYIMGISGKKKKNLWSKQQIPSGGSDTWSTPSIHFSLLGLECRRQKKTKTTRQHLIIH